MVEFAVLLPLIVALGALVVTLYERRQDVLYGPYLSV